MVRNWPLGAMHSRNASIIMTRHLLADQRCAKVAKLADAPDLGSGGATRGGSSPPFRTNILRKKVPFSLIKMNNQERRVVVTGVGLVSPVGIGTEETWKALQQGESGVGNITLFDATGFSCKIAGEVKDFVPEDYIERKEVKKMGRFIQFAMAAAEFAVKQAALDMTAEDAGRVGVYVGSGIGAFEVIEREHSKLLSAGPHRVSPFFITATIANLAAGQISIRYGAAGPNLACATACTTGERMRLASRTG